MTATDRISFRAKPKTQRLLARAMKERLGVTRTFIIEEALALGLAKYAKKKDQ